MNAYDHAIPVNTAGRPEFKIVNKSSPLSAASFNRHAAGKTARKSNLIECSREVSIVFFRRNSLISEES
jgi:hypothetical protein